MKIIHCLNYFFPEHIAGTEIYTLSLIQELKKKNISSIVLIPNFGSSKTVEYAVKEIRVIKYAEPSVSDKEMLMGKRKPEGLKAFSEILKEEEPFIVHFHEFSSSNGITQHHIHIAREMGLKVIMTFHLSGYSCKTGNLMYRDESLCDGVIQIKKCTDCVYSVKHIPYLKKELLLVTAMLGYKLNYDSGKWGSTIGTAIGFPFIIRKLKTDLEKLAKDCNQLVVLTRWYKKILENNGISVSKITYIAQGLPWHKKVLLPKHVENNLLRLVYIGRISPVKGIQLLIDSMQTLPAGKVILDIYGKVNDDEYSNTCRNTSSVLSNVTWKGSVSPESVVTVLSGYDVLCVPSAFSEMSPLVIQEAFAAGIPVLASDVYGNAEQVIDGKNGWLFKFNNSNDLKLKLQAIIDNPEWVSFAKQQIPPIRSFSEVAAEYEILYNKVMLQS